MNQTDYSDLPLINEGHLKSLADLGKSSPGFFSGLLDHYFNKVPELLRDLSQASSLTEYNRIEFVAHKIKGMSGSLGGTRLEAICQEIENYGELKSTDRPRLNALIDLSKTTFELTQRALTNFSAKIS